MPAVPRPQRGDLVIHERGRAPRHTWVLCIAPGTGEISSSNYEHALSSAKGYARQEGVDVWFSNETTSDGHPKNARPLARFRPG